MELRIKRLEERLSETPKKARFSWLTDPSRLVSIAALIISLTTTIHTWRRDALQSQESRRRQFDSAIEQLIDNALKNYEYVKSNRNAENFGAMASWFTSQALIMRDKAANAMSGLDDVTPGQYILVGNAMMNAGQPNRAAKLFQKAVELAQVKREEDAGYLHKVEAWFGISPPPEPETFDIASIVELASAYISLGSSYYAANNFEEAPKQFDKAISVYRDSTKYPESNKNEAYAFVHKFWAETLAQKLECAQSREHFVQAEKLFPPVRKSTQDMDWSSIEYGITWTTQCLAKPPAAVAPPSLQASTPFPKP